MSWVAFFKSIFGMYCLQRMLNPKRSSRTKQATVFQPNTSSDCQTNTSWGESNDTDGNCQKNSK